MKTEQNVNEPLPASDLFGVLRKFLAKHNADEIEWDAVDKLEEEYAADAARIELLTDAGGLMRAWIGEGEKGITERWDSVSAPNDQALPHGGAERTSNAK